MFVHIISMQFLETCFIQEKVKGEKAGKERAYTIQIMQYLTIILSRKYTIQ